MSRGDPVPAAVLGGARPAHPSQVQHHAQADTGHQGDVRDVADKQPEVVDEVDDMATRRPGLARFCPST